MAKASRWLIDRRKSPKDHPFITRKPPGGQLWYYQPDVIHPSPWLIHTFVEGRAKYHEKLILMAAGLRCMRALQLMMRQGSYPAANGCLFSGGSKNGS